jgi:hypothetical protein
MAGFMTGNDQGVASMLPPGALTGTNYVGASDPRAMVANQSLIALSGTNPSGIGALTDSYLMTILSDIPVMGAVNTGQPAVPIQAGSGSIFPAATVPAGVPPMFAANTLLQPVETTMNPDELLKMEPDKIQEYLEEMPKSEREKYLEGFTDEQKDKLSDKVEEDKDNGGGGDFLDTIGKVAGIASKVFGFGIF